MEYTCKHGVHVCGTCAEERDTLEQKFLRDAHGGEPTPAPEGCLLPNLPLADGWIKVADEWCVRQYEGELQTGSRALVCSRAGDWSEVQLGAHVVDRKGRQHYRVVETWFRCTRDDLQRSRGEKCPT